MAATSRWTLGGVLLLVGRLALAVIFLAAAYGKLSPLTAPQWTLGSLKITSASLKLSMTFFAMQLSSYQMFPDWAVSPIAHVLPWIEVALVILLLAGVGLRYVAAGATVLLALFWAVIIRSYAMHLGINCGCFGPNEKLTGWRVVEDGGFFALGLAVAIGALIFHRRAHLRAPASSQTEFLAR